MIFILMNKTAVALERSLEKKRFQQKFWELYFLRGERPEEKKYLEKGLEGMGVDFGSDNWFCDHPEGEKGLLRDGVEQPWFFSM